MFTRKVTIQCFRASFIRIIVYYQQRSSKQPFCEENWFRTNSIQPNTDERQNTSQSSADAFNVTDVENHPTIAIVDKNCIRAPSSDQFVDCVDESFEINETINNFIEANTVLSTPSTSRTLPCIYYSDDKMLFRT